MRVAALVSGTGSILDAMFEASVPVSLVLADRSCQALERATKAGVEPLLVARTSFGPDFDRLGYTEKVVNELQDRHIDLIVMAGFGTVFSEPVHAAYGGRIINTHPSLLPAFPGWHAVADALAYGVKITGCTVHVAGVEVDTGPILAQEAVAVLGGDDEATLHERIKAVEHRLLPEAVALVAGGRVRLDGRSTSISEPAPGGRA